MNSSRPPDVFHAIRYYAIETASVISLILVLAKALWHELRNLF